MEGEKKCKQKKIIFAGFGGQGVKTVGGIIANAACESEKQITLIPSYGPEMRGGTCNCHLIISDFPIGSPLISKGRADTVMAFNQQSSDKFLEYLKPNGLIILNSSTIKKDYDFGSKTAVKVPLDDLAMENFHNPKSMNMIAIGVYLNLKMKGVIKLETVQEIICSMFAKKIKGDKEKNEMLAKINCQALEFGFNLDISKYIAGKKAN